MTNRFEAKRTGLKNPDGHPCELTVTTNHGRVFVDHYNLIFPGDRDYKETLELTIPEALELLDMLKELFEK
jgi:hypothetical protein